VHCLDGGCGGRSEELYPEARAHRGPQHHGKLDVASKVKRTFQFKLRKKLSNLYFDLLEFCLNGYLKLQCHFSELRV